MATSTTNLAAFGTQLVNFFSDLADTFPEDVDIRRAATAVNTLRKMNPRLLHSKFMEVVYDDFREALLREDEDYLVRRAKEVLESEYADMAYAYWVFDKHWSKMTELNRKHVWDYCKVLLVLAERAAEGSAVSSSPAAATT